MKARVLTLLTCIALSGCGATSSPLNAANFVATWTLDKTSFPQAFKTPPPEGSAKITLKAKNICDLVNFPNLVASNMTGPLSPEDIYSGDGTWKYLSAEGCIEISFKQHERNYFVRLKANENELSLQLGDPDDMKNLIYRRAQSTQ